MDIRAMGASEWIALGTMIAACIAAWQAIRSTRLSDRMYSLLISEHRRTEPAVEVYLVDSRILHLTNGQRRVYVFHLLITNKSMAANSIKEVRFSLKHGQQDQPSSNIVIPHDSKSASMVGIEATEIIRVPSPIAAGETVLGAVAFPIADALLENDSVEGYIVTVLDAHDREAHCQAILLREKEL